MNKRIQVLIITALIALGAVGLAVALTQCGGQPTPATGTPPTTQLDATEPATAAPGTTMAIVPDTPTAELDAPAETPTLTPTPTEGEKAAATMAADANFTYYPTVAECLHAVEERGVEGCTAFESARQVARPEWEQLFPETNFYEIQFVGRHQDWVYDYYHHSEVAAWQNGKHYTAETFDRLLKANGVITITDENRELVAKAFALMTIPDCLEGEIVFTEWEEGEWQSGSLLYTNYLKAWTEIQGLEMEIWWWFIFEDNWLKTVTRLGRISKYPIGDFDGSLRELSPPPAKDYYFRGE